MATLLSHFALGWGAYRCVEGGRDASRTGPLVAACLSVLPDADALLMRWIPYESPWGHRGFTHSLAFAAAAALVAAAALRGRVALPGGFAGLWATLAVTTASHGVLDALTNGGLGIAFFAPFDATRTFLPVTPIPVSPISVNLLDPWIWRVVAAEAVMLGPPAIFLATVRRPMAWQWRAAIAAALLVSVRVWMVRCD